MRTWTFFAALLLMPALAFGVTVEGTSYPTTVTIEGKTLKLVGAGPGGRRPPREVVLRRLYHGGLHRLEAERQEARAAFGR